MVHISLCRVLTGRHSLVSFRKSESIIPNLNIKCASLNSTTLRQRSWAIGQRPQQKDTQILALEFAHGLWSLLKPIQRKYSHILENIDFLEVQGVVAGDLRATIPPHYCF